MSKGVDHFFCREQYHISDTVRHNLVAKKGCSNLLIKAYNWSESWFHVNGPVREVHSIALESIKNGTLKSHYEETSDDRTLFMKGCRAIGVGLKELVGVVLTVPAFIIRAYGRYHYIQAAADTKTVDQEFTEFLKQENLTVKDLYDFKALREKTPSNFYQEVTNRLLTTSNPKYIPSDIKKFTPEQKIQIFNHFYLDSDKFIAKHFFKYNNIPLDDWGTAIDIHRPALKDLLFKNLENYQLIDFLKTGISLTDILEKNPKNYKKFIHLFWNPGVNTLDPKEVEVVKKFLSKKTILNFLINLKIK